MKWLRYLSFSLLGLLLAALALAGHYYYKAYFKPGHSIQSFAATANEEEILKIRNKAEQIKEFAQEKNYSQTIIFLIDMSLPSGKNRFFIYDCKKDSVIATALVAHGSGNYGFSLNAKFSNACESGYSSLGKYKIGKKYHGSFGIAYKLYGLDSSNSNAFKRNIVLHAYDCVPRNETYPYPICNSRGCPMVSPDFMKEIQQIIDTDKKPVVLWVFN
ncbi:MAG TPA: murein L,D-transpeptidase catalytic domain family protein [Puia sp.]|nr:murein L,D-transpeptidase catalytic domain family protein [Puia sp.]